MKEYSLYFVVYTSCNKITPTIIAIGTDYDSMIYRIHTICENNVPLTIYQDEEEENDEEDYSQPLSVSDIDNATHVVSYELTKLQNKKVLEKSEQDYNCLHCTGVLSIFGSDDKSINMIEVINKIKIV